MVCQLRCDLVRLPLVQRLQCLRDLPVQQPAFPTAEVVVEIALEQGVRETVA